MTSGSNFDRKEKIRKGVAFYPPLLPIVPLVESFITGPNVAPMSVLVLRSGSSLVALRSHHVTNTLSPDASICASCDSDLVELLRLCVQITCVLHIADSVDKEGKRNGGVW